MSHESRRALCDGGKEKETAKYFGNGNTGRKVTEGYINTQKELGVQRKNAVNNYHTRSLGL
jgi:hypothetical protein